MRPALVLPLLVAACVAPHQAALNQAIINCNYGDPYACRSIPELNALVQQENYNNQVAAGIAATAIGAAAVGAAVASGPGWHGGPGPVRGPGPGFRGPPPHP